MKGQLSAIWFKEQLEKSGHIEDKLSNNGQVKKGFLSQLLDLNKKTKGKFFDENYLAMWDAWVTDARRRGTRVALAVGETLFPTLLKDRIEIQFVDRYELAPTDLENIFTKRPSGKRSGKIVQLQSDSGIDFVEPQQKYPQGFLAETTTEFTNRKAGQILEIDEETIKFDDLGAILDATDEIADDMRNFEEEQRAKALVSATFQTSGSFINQLNASGGLTVGNVGDLMSLATKIKKPNGKTARVKVEWLIVAVKKWGPAGQILAQQFENPGSVDNRVPPQFRILFPSLTLMVSSALDEIGVTGGTPGDDFFSAARGGLVENVVFDTQMFTQRGQLTKDGFDSDIILKMKVRFLKSFVVKDNRRVFFGKAT